MVIVVVGLVHTVVSISACGAEHPGSIPGLDKDWQDICWENINMVLYHLWTQT